MRRLVIIFLLIILPLVVYSQTQYHAFVWDDAVNVKEDPYLRSVSLTNVLRFWQRPYEDLDIPLTYSICHSVVRYCQCRAGSALAKRSDAFQLRVETQFRQLGGVLRVGSKLG